MLVAVLYDVRHVAFIVCQNRYKKSETAVRISNHKVPITGRDLKQLHIWKLDLQIHMIDAIKFFEASCIGIMATFLEPELEQSVSS